MISEIDTHDWDEIHIERIKSILDYMDNSSMFPDDYTALVYFVLKIEQLKEKSFRKFPKLERE